MKSWSDILRANGIVPHDPSTQAVETVTTAATKSLPANSNSVSRKRKVRVKDENSDAEIDPEDEEDKRKEAQLAVRIVV